MTDEEEPEPSAEVIELFGERPDPVVERGPRPSYCPHDRYTLDREARRVYCKRCDREVPAFDALIHFARVYEQHRDAVESLIREERRRTASLEEVERKEKNAKARLRRVRQRLPSDA